MSSSTKVKPKIVTSSWKYSNVNVDRSTLSDELAEFCAKYPIIRLQEAATEDSVSVEAEHGKGHIRFLSLDIKVKYEFQTTLLLCKIRKLTSGLFPKFDRKNRS